MAKFCNYVRNCEICFRRLNAFFSSYVIKTKLENFTEKLTSKKFFEISKLCVTSFMDNSLLKKEVLTFSINLLPELVCFSSLRIWFWWTFSFGQIFSRRHWTDRGSAKHIADATFQWLLLNVKLCPRETNWKSSPFCKLLTLICLKEWLIRPWKATKSMALNFGQKSNHCKFLLPTPDTVVKIVKQRSPQRILSPLLHNQIREVSLMLGFSELVFQYPQNLPNLLMFGPPIL